MDNPSYRWTLSAASAGFKNVPTRQGQPLRRGLTERRRPSESRDRTVDIARHGRPCRSSSMLVESEAEPASVFGRDSRAVLYTSVSGAAGRRRSHVRPRSAWSADSRLRWSLRYQRVRQSRRWLSLPARRHLGRRPVITCNWMRPPNVSPASCLIGGSMSAGARTGAAADAQRSAGQHRPGLGPLCYRSEQRAVPGARLVGDAGLGQRRHRRMTATRS